VSAAHSVQQGPQRLALGLLHLSGPSPLANSDAKARRSAGRCAFFLTFSITQRDAPPDAAAATPPSLVALVGEVPSMLRAIGAAVVTRSRQTRRALCGMSVRNM
jgi:hypothetical protein